MGCQERGGRPTGELRLRKEWEVNRAVGGQEKKNRGWEKVEAKRGFEAKSGWEDGKKIRGQKRVGAWAKTRGQKGCGRPKIKGNHTCFNRASFHSLLITNFKLMNQPPF